jgi:branched-chain amino acid transport system substrate-binding protein
MLSRLIVFCTTLALIAAAGSSSPARAAADPYEINVIVSLTGQAALIGQAEAQSLQLIEAITNKSGGINGRPIKFVIADDQTNPQNAVQLTSAFLNGKTAMILGPAFTASCLAMEPLVIKTGPVEYCFSPGIPPTPGSYVYSATVSARDDEVATVRYLRLRGWTRVAFLATTDATGQAFESGFDYAMALPENKGMQVVAREHCNATDISMNAQISRIKAAGPQVMIAWAAGTPFGTELRAIHDVGLELPIVGGNGNMIQAQLAQYSAILPAELYFAGRRALAPDPSAPPAVRKAQTLYFTTMREANVHPSLLNILSWDPAMIYLDALRHLGANPTAADVNGYIQKLHGWAGIQGFYDFRDGSQRGIGSDGTVIDRWDAAKGDFVSVSAPAGYLR